MMKAQDVSSWLGRFPIALLSSKPMTIGTSTSAVSMNPVLVTEA